MFTLEENMIQQNVELDNLTFSYSKEKKAIEKYIIQAEDNHSYTKSKKQIDEEKFQERIIVYPKDDCRIS